MAAPSINQLTFANGDAMPALGLGTWRAAAGEVGAAVLTALELGYRHLDCAAIYGNEREIGKALAKAFASGLLRREELWVTSKLWNDAHAPADVRPALAKTLSDLGLEQLDLYLMHWPVALRPGDGPDHPEQLISLEQQPLTATWAAMEALVDEGLCRHIGVSNFKRSSLELLLGHSRLAPAMNQIERHPYLQQQDLLHFCQGQQILITGYRPLGSPPSPEKPGLLNDPVVQAIAAENAATPAQVVLAWGLQQGTAVIPKSVRAPRLASNLAASQLRLSAAAMGQMASLERNERLVSASMWTSPGSPYSQESLWG
jgi:alcohol dehydrogenase (NADP+)